MLSVPAFTKEQVRSFNFAVMCMLRLQSEVGQSWSIIKYRTMSSKGILICKSSKVVKLEIRGPLVVWEAQLIVNSCMCLELSVK